jgi:2-polyprenyl-3-methyl-5-hydroxy-6-metoxy-1,4-benzoquinol methylase
VTTQGDDLDSLDKRFYESYISTHAGCSSATAADLSYRRQLRPHLPAKTHGRRVLDIGCGQGDLVRLLLSDGFDAWGVDHSPEQVEVARRAGLDRIELGDFHAYLDSTRYSWDAVIATDVLEHLDKAQIVRTLDHARQALRPGGVFIARVPNAVSPMGGCVMYGDFTHQTWFTRRSVMQLAAVAGFDSVHVFPCSPVAHGLKSAARVLVWKSFSAGFKLALAAETGQLRGHIVTQNLTFVATTT